MRKQTITETRPIGQCDLLRAFYVWCFWGNPKHLDKFIQNYAIEKARLEARKLGHTVIEQHLEDGFVKLTVQVGAAA